MTTPITISSCGRRDGIRQHLSLCRHMRALSGERCQKGVLADGTALHIRGVWLIIYYLRLTACSKLYEVERSTERNAGK